jgi:hypothetical protein
MTKRKDLKVIRHGKLGGGENKHARMREIAGEGTNSESNLPPRDRRCAEAARPEFCKIRCLKSRVSTELQQGGNFE